MATFGNGVQTGMAIIAVQTRQILQAPLEALAAWCAAVAGAATRVTALRGVAISANPTSGTTAMASASLLSLFKSSVDPMPGKALGLMKSINI